MMFYPVVGLLLGLLTLGLYKFASHAFTPAMSLTLAFVLGILLTGGLHIDGFADMCDGFYAGKDKAGILAVMKDSHVGTMAVIGVFCLLTLKLSLLFSIFLKGGLSQAFLLTPSISRWVMTVMAASFPYARPEGGTAKPFVESAGKFEVAVASILMMAIAYFFAGTPGILTALFTLVSAFIFMRWVKEKIGGITGDVLGGLNEISEVTALLIFNLAYQTPKAGWIS